ncbi:hypothetical protein J4N45_15080 [Vibrio sp. SCSIO 43140]|uniref:hypothetical protein n=1 Tax=Vibrio sp. SCSIO 43140 TaxID=2819100 RepID=UPI0020759F69|nr:hypothetical protein [Vibrio sp. SCSIO 43140]USD59823.1 hypothetical protein J4N45_15080 [Vibrio sp. SCSIO 43140]
MKRLFIAMACALMFSMPSMANSYSAGGNVIGSVVECTLPDGSTKTTYQLYCKMANGHARY